MTQPPPTGARKPRPGKLVTAGLLASLLALLAIALVSTAGAQGPRRNTPLIQDWSHRHVIFPNNPNRPMTLGGPQQNIRAWLAWLQRNAWAFQVAPFQAPAPSRPPVSLFPNRPQKKGFKTDWAVSLGSTSAGGGVAENMFPAKYSFDITAAPSCTDDFVIFPVNSNPGTGQANIVAFNQLYRGASSGLCGTGAPNTMWAYKVGSGPVKTSPALYWDSNLSNSGTAVAFVESQTSASVFHIVPAKGASGGSIGSPITPTSDRYVQYASATNTRSSPFIDYANDVAYVGADDGVLYKIGPVFKSVASPVVIHSTTVSSGKKLTAPVYDPGSDRVFVSDGLLVYAYQPTAGGFVFKASIQIGYPNTPAYILDPVIVDSGQWVYIFSGGNNVPAGSRRAVVVQTNTALTSSVSADIGAHQDENGYSIQAGAFDNAYYTDPSTGKLYTCGNAGGGSAGASTLYKLGFQSNGTLQSTPEVNLGVSDGASGKCSPLTTFYNLNLSPPERLFFGQTNTSISKSNHIQMWYLPVTSPDTMDAGDTTTKYTGGTSGIIVDNARTEAQASSVYFGTRLALAACGNRVCAVKLTQSALE